MIDQWTLVARQCPEQSGVALPMMFGEGSIDILHHRASLVGRAKALRQQRFGIAQAGAFLELPALDIVVGKPAGRRMIALGPRPEIEHRANPEREQTGHAVRRQAVERSRAEHQPVTHAPTVRRFNSAEIAQIVRPLDIEVPVRRGLNDAFLRKKSLHTMVLNPLILWSRRRIQSSESTGLRYNLVI